jgi:hypothetical protein
LSTSAFTRAVTPGGCTGGSMLGVGAVGAGFAEVVSTAVGFDDERPSPSSVSPP